MFPVLSSQCFLNETENMLSAVFLSSYILEKAVETLFPLHSSFSHTSNRVYIAREIEISIAARVNYQA